MSIRLPRKYGNNYIILPQVGYRIGERRTDLGIWAIPSGLVRVTKTREILRGFVKCDVGSISQLVYK
jgi:hypothetical protein